VPTVLSGEQIFSLHGGMKVNNDRIMMIRYAGSILLILLSFMPWAAYGQGKAKLNEEIAAKFSQYCSSVPREEVYLNTDRDDYIAGEPVWINAYLFNRQSSKLTDESSIVYIELLNPVNQPIIQKKIRIEMGSGPGNISLPDTLSTGKYILRGYTNWMKNFLPVNCFMKEINIYNSISSRTLSGRPGNGPAPKKNEPDINSSLQDKGLSVNIISAGKDTVNIVINANESFRLGNGSTCYLFIQTHGVINLNESVRLYGPSTLIPVPKNTLIPGINQVTLFNSAGEPIFEKYIYTPASSRGLLTVNAPESIQKRSKVVIEINPEMPANSNLGISVSAANNYNSVGIDDYLVFGTEFGLLPDNIRGKKLSALSSEAIADILMTAKSNWLDWKMIMSEQLPDIKYRMENEYHNLSGHLVSSGTMNPDTGQYVFLSRPGKVAYFQYAKTGKDGKFTFALPAILDGKDIVIQPADPERNDLIRIESSFPGTYFPVIATDESPDADQAGYLDRLSVNYQVGKIFSTSSTGDNIIHQEPAAEPGKFYGKADNTLIMDNYIKLPVMQEVFFELIPGVTLKSKKSSWDVIINDPVDFSIYSTPPLLMIDGVIVKDASLIANLDPEIVERIETVRDKYIVGDFLIYGLVNVITRSGDFSCVTLPDYAVRLSWRVADPVNSFISPEYSSQDLRKRHIPDFRNTLYWNPSIKPGKDGKYMVEFWSSDFASDYEINIQGVAGDSIVSFRKLIKVE
jgi:hypothetical protein